MEILPEYQRSSVIVDISTEFVDLNSSELRSYIRQKIKEEPWAKFSAIIDWNDKQTVRNAKALLEDSRYHIESITVRATRKQYEEDVNAFESGVKWEEII
jgi:hypothetical protein